METAPATVVPCLTPTRFFSLPAVTKLARLLILFNRCHAVTFSTFVLSSTVVLTRLLATGALARAAAAERRRRARLDVDRGVAVG